MPSQSDTVEEKRKFPALTPRKEDKNNTNNNDNNKVAKWD